MPALTYRAYLETEVSLPIHAHLLLDDGDGALLLESLTADGDLNALRSQPHTSKLYCAVLAPQVDVIAVVTVDSITGDVFPQTVEYTLVSGDDTLIRSGMSAWVGDAAHDDSLGRVRARATPGAGFLYLAENSDIDWSIGAYITFYNEYLPWPRYPYVQPDGTIFKDYAINFFTPPNSQTVLWPPVAMMGSCGVGVMHGGVAYVLFDGGESYATAPGAVIDTFAWVFPDGTPATDTNQAPGWVAFSTQGVKQVQLTVTDTNGIATISRRAILIVDLDAPLYPYYAYTDFGVESWEGDTDTGWGTKLRVFGTSDRTYFSERAVVMLYAEETYGGEAAGEATAGPFAGGTFASNASVGNVAWTNPSNAATLNQVYATATLPLGQSSQYLLVTNCGFALPTQGAIRGVRVRVTAHASDPSTVYDLTVRLFVAGAAVGSNLGTAALLPVTDTVLEYGGENNLWGLTLVPAVVNLSTFGVGITFSHSPSGVPTVYVDYVDITVWYNTGAVLGFEAYRSNVKHMGYILDDSVSVDPQTNEVSFETGSISRVAEKLYGFPTIVQDKSEPATWSEGYALTMRRATLYLLYWHTTFMQIADVMIEDDSTPVQIADFPKSSLWDMLRNWIASTRIGHAYVTKNGRVTVARDAQIMTLAERNALDVVMQLQSNDWREEVEISESVLSVLAFLDWSGVWYEGNPDVAPIPLFSKAPGDAPKVYGRDEAVQYLVLDSQITSNTLAGLYLAWKNNVSNLVRVSMAGNWVSAFDPGYVEYVQAPVGGFVTKRGTLLADARLIVRSMSIDADTANGVLLPTLVLEAESTTLHNQGESGDYPPGAIPAQGAACPLGMVWDSEARECVLQADDPSPFPWSNTWRSSMYVATVDRGVYFTDNFSGPGGAQPTWKAVNKGLSATGALACMQMVSDPYNPSLLYMINANNGDNSVLYKWDVAAQEWTALHTAKVWSAAHGIPSGGVLLDTVYFSTLMVSSGRPAGYLALYLTQADAPNRTTWFSESTDFGSTWSTAVKIDVSGGVNWNQSVQSRGVQGQFKGTQAQAAGEVILCPLQKRLGVGTSKLWYSTDRGATWTATAFTDPTFNFEIGTFFIDPSDQAYAWYAQGDIKRFTGTAGAVTTKLAGVGSAYKNAMDVLYSPTGPASVVRVFDGIDAVNKRRLYKSDDTGASWTSEDDTGSDFTDAGAPYGVMVLPDSDGLLYGFASDDPGTGEHSIGVSDDEGLNWEGKSGSAAGRAPFDTSDGTGIPSDCGGIVDVCIVWNVK